MRSTATIIKIVILSAGFMLLFVILSVAKDLCNGQCHYHVGRTLLSANA
jgi:hypothetical protein